MVANAAATETRDADAAEIIQCVRTGKWRGPVEKIRAKFARALADTGDLKQAKNAVDSAKKKLPGILWSGRFSSRKKPADEKLLTHSGLLCADLDNLGDKLADVRGRLTRSPNLWALFTSPTGNGVKAVFRVPADKENHAASFLAVEKHVLELTGEKVDGSCKDVARLCFVSFDPDALLNPAAVELPPLVETEKPTLTVAVACSAPEIETRRRIAVELVGAIEWNTDAHGFCVCPGQHLHTTSNSPRDCEIHIESVPTIHCFHGSCGGIVAGVNHELRSRIGKTEKTSATAAQADLSGDDAKEIQRLAALPLLEYERQRGAAAERLGCREAALDKLVGDARPKKADAGLQGRSVKLTDAEPWPEAVNGAELLDDVAETFARYAALPSGAADALALWCAHAHAFKAFLCSPRLNIFSPEKGCGKTTLRDVVAVLVPRPLLTENLSVAVLFRLVEAHAPTVLADEYDAWLRDNEEMRGLLNAGHRRGGQALRCEGDGHEVRGFNVFAPAVLCGIGALPGTLHDRSIVIRLERAKPGEVRERFDSRRTSRENELCRKLARFCADNSAHLEACDPELPPGAFNRLADNWRPLFAIAEIAGGDWPARATVAFASLTGQEPDEARGAGVSLLTDIRAIFNETGSERIWTETLCERLNEMPERPHADMRGGKGINAHRLGKQLGRFKVSSRKIRLPGEAKPKQGYCRADFQDAFERYLPSEGDSKRNIGTSPENIGDALDSEAEQPEPMFHSQNAEIPNSSAGCSKVPLSKPGQRENESSEAMLL
jgi:hypothetical protein